MGVLNRFEAVEAKVTGEKSEGEPARILRFDMRLTISGDFDEPTKQAIAHERGENLHRQQYAARRGELSSVYRLIPLRTALAVNQRCVFSHLRISRSRLSFDRRLIQKMPSS